jgi:hypothetical protein
MIGTGQLAERAPGLGWLGRGRITLLQAILRALGQLFESSSEQRRLDFGAAICPLSPTGGPGSRHARWP